jgi:hypothetical protein
MDGLLSASMTRTSKRQRLATLRLPNSSYSPAVAPLGSGERMPKGWKYAVHITTHASCRGRGPARVRSRMGVARSARSPLIQPLQGGLQHQGASDQFSMSCWRHSLQLKLSSAQGQALLHSLGREPSQCCKGCRVHIVQLRLGVRVLGQLPGDVAVLLGRVDGGRRLDVHDWELSGST